MQPQPATIFAPAPKPKLERSLSLVQATAINMIDMVGIGPFVTLSVIVLYMQGPASIIAWLIGALLAMADGAIWAELGAKWPEAGGSYAFLQKLFGKRGRMMAFLFVWQTSIQAPLVMASAAIGFAHYVTYLIPLTDWQQRIVSGTLVLAMMALLYRKTGSIGKISVVLSVITIGTLLWVVGSGLLPASPVPGPLPNATQPIGHGWLAAVAVGFVTRSAMYSYLGYYNVCHLGAEIKNPSRNIPRAIFISIAGIALLYIGMQIAVLHVLPWQHVAKSDFVMSLYFQQLYGPAVAKVATCLILIIALSSLFSVMLGYSRIPYAAAAEGNFFPVFAKLHPRLHIPHISLLVMGGLAFIFSLLFKMADVIQAIIVIRIVVQFLAQAIGVLLWHHQKPTDERPFRMPLFPIPVFISIIIWLFLLCTSSPKYLLLAAGIITTGLILYHIIPWPERPVIAAPVEPENSTLNQQRL